MDVRRCLAWAAAALVVAAAADAHAFLLFVTRSGQPYNALNREQIANAGSAPLAAIDPAEGVVRFDLWYDLEGQPILALELHLETQQGAVFTGLASTSGSLTPQIPGSRDSNMALWALSEIVFDPGAAHFVAIRGGSFSFDCTFLGAGSASMPGGNCPVGGGTSDGMSPSGDGTMIWLAGTFELDMTAWSGSPGDPIIDLDIPDRSPSFFIPDIPGSGGVTLTAEHTLTGAATILTASTPEPGIPALLSLMVVALWSAGRARPA